MQGQSQGWGVMLGRAREVAVTLWHSCCSRLFESLTIVKDSPSLGSCLCKRQKPRLSLPNASQQLVGSGPVMGSLQIIRTYQTEQDTPKHSTVPQNTVEHHKIKQDAPREQDCKREQDAPKHSRQTCWVPILGCSQKLLPGSPEHQECQCPRPQDLLQTPDTAHRVDPN